MSRSEHGTFQNTVDDRCELLSMRPWCVSDLLAVRLLGVGCSIKAAAYQQFDSHKQSEVAGC